jgi:hypothetical protein
MRLSICRRGSRTAPFTRDRVDTARRERGRHHAHVAAVHLDRALPEVQVERLVDVDAEDVEVAQHVRNRAIAVPVAASSGNRFIERQAATCIREQRKQRSQRSSGERPSTSDVDAIAPALIIGLKAVPCGARG